MRYSPVLTLPLLVALPVILWAGEYDASIGFARKVTLGFPVSGNVDHVGITAGEAVKTGKLLASLDDLPYRAAVLEAESVLALAATEKTETERDYRLATELYDRTVLSSVELENAKLKAVRGGANYSRAEARLSRAQYELANTKVIAPFDAWTLEVQVREGQSVISKLGAHPAVTLAEQGRYIAYTEVPGSVSDSLRIGQSAGVVVANTLYEGRIRLIAVEPSNGKTGESALYKVGVEFHSTEARLRAGQTAKVKLP